MGLLGQEGKETNGLIMGNFLFCLTGNLVLTCAAALAAAIVLPHDILLLTKTIRLHQSNNHD